MGWQDLPARTAPSGPTSSQRFRHPPRRRHCRRCWRASARSRRRSRGPSTGSNAGARHSFATATRLRWYGALGRALPRRERRPRGVRAPGHPAAELRGLLSDALEREIIAPLGALVGAVHDVSTAGEPVIEKLAAFARVSSSAWMRSCSGRRHLAACATLSRASSRGCAPSTSTFWSASSTRRSVR